jgi:hypothetical protein
MLKCLKIIVLSALFIATACSPGRTAENPAPSITVSLNGIKVAEVSIPDIAKLPQVSIRINDIEKHGPTLQKLLDDIGIISYMGLVASGYSRDHSQELSKELTENDFTTDIILTVNQGIVAIFGLSVPPEYWDMEITTLSVVACECGL